jgi:hypothetical protein
VRPKSPVLPPGVLWSPMIPMKPWKDPVVPIAATPVLRELAR